METGYKISDVMEQNVATIDVNSTVLQAAKLMAQKEVGSLVVTNHSIPVGIITEQDVARKVVAKEINASSTNLVDVMSAKLHTIEPSKDMYHASVLMSNHKIKHLPVVVNDELQGIISFKDIIQMQPSLIEMLSFKNTR